MREIDFNQMEKHVDAAINNLRTVQYAGKYPKKVCRAAMFGANMLGVDRNTISLLRDNNDQLESENKRLREALEESFAALERLLDAGESDKKNEVVNARNQAHFTSMSNKQLLNELEGGKDE